MRSPAIWAFPCLWLSLLVHVILYKPRRSCKLTQYFFSKNFNSPALYVKFSIHKMSAQFQNIFKATFPYHWGEFDFFELLLKEERRRHCNTGFHHKNHGLFLGTKKTCQQSKKSKWKSLSPPSKQIKKYIKRLYWLCLEFFGQFWSPTYSKTFVQLAGCLNIIRAAFFKLKQNIIAIVYLLVHSDQFKGILVPICGNFCISAFFLAFFF